MTTQACPNCGATIPIEIGYVAWCEHCSWNVVAPEVRQPKSRFERAYASAGRRLGERLAAELMRADTLQPRLAPARAAAYLIAAGVHLFTLTFVAAGAFTIVSTFPSVLGIVLGLLVASPALLFMPRLGKLDKDANSLQRRDAPTLFALIDELASALSTKRATVVVIDTDFNASWAVIGWRRRRVLTLGLPLLTALDPQERVALLAHELAHSKNGDASRGVVIGGAIGALQEIYMLVRPERRAVGAEFFLNFVFIVVAKPVEWLIHLEFHLLRRDSQRAEYLADALAATVAGSAAVVALHEKLLLQPTVRAVVQHAVRATDEDLFESLVHAVHSVPERERERRRRVARLEESRLAASHPPTGLRIALLEGRDRVGARVLLDEARSSEIDRELHHFRPEFQRTLIDDYRATVYHR